MGAARRQTWMRRAKTLANIARQPRLTPALYRNTTGENSVKQCMKTLVIGGLFAALAACHENPLPKQDDQELTAQFLLKASTFAEKKLDFKTSSTRRWGRGYMDCIVKKVQDTRGCEPLYTEMAVFAKAYEEGELSDITTGDLRDKRFQRHIASWYKNRLFFATSKDGIL